MDRDSWEVLGKDALAVRLTFYKLNRLDSADPAGGKTESTDAAEGVK
jgi:hypothetical protein